MARNKVAVCLKAGCPEIRPCPAPGHERVSWAGSNRRATLPPDWNRRRQRILRRDPTCRIRSKVCTILSVEVDHINDPMDHDESNLRGVCSPCHAEHTKQQAAEGRRRARG